MKVYLVRGYDDDPEISVSILPFDDIDYDDKDRKMLTFQSYTKYIQLKKNGEDSDMYEYLLQFCPEPETQYELEI